jgi:hypothetical protein
MAHVGMATRPRYSTIFQKPLKKIPKKKAAPLWTNSARQRTAKDRQAGSLFLLTIKEIEITRLTVAKVKVSIRHYYL